MGPRLHDHALMTAPPSLLLRCVLAASTVMTLLQGCAVAQPAPASTEQLAAQIQALVGDAACDGPAQCRTIAVGARACGGPDSYLAWSTLRTDERRLRELVRQHAEQRRADNRAERSASICLMETDPGATCRARRCTLNPRGQGTAPSRAD